MHPITFIEILFSVGLFLILLVIFMLVFRKRKIVGYMLTGAVALVIVAFFVFRPYWIDYQIIEKMTMLEDYLEDRYPKEKWDITAIDHRTYRQYNPYHLIVAFESEPGWQYAYYVSSEGNVKQVWHSVDSEHENLNGDGKFLE